AFGLPRQVLSDNHLSFTGRRYHMVVEFERRLKDAGVTLINGRPRHPETQGKIERFHRTVREWLTDEGPPRTLGELQVLMDRFRVHYNTERPHQGLPGDVTPAQRYFPAPEALPPDVPMPEEPQYPADAAVRTVAANGTLTYDNKRIGVGVRWSRRRVRVVRAGELTHVYYGELLIRSLKIDPARRYQHRPNPDYTRRRPRS